MNYTVGDFLIRVKNAYMAGRDGLIVPSTKITKAIAQILKNEGYIKNLKEEVNDNKKTIKINLSYHNRTPSILDVKIISKPSLRVYIKSNEIKNITRDMGTHILSTNKGLVTAKDALEKNLGGELICHIV